MPLGTIQATSRGRHGQKKHKTYLRNHTAQSFHILYETFFINPANHAPGVIKRHYHGGH